MHWFIESTRPEAAEARAVVNHWYQAFPDPKGHLRAKLRSEEDAKHYQALDELYLHHLLSQRHADIRYEEHGRGPDFRIYHGDACVGAIEVLSLFQRQDWTDEQFRHGRLADQLDARVPATAGYFVNFQIKAADRDPSPRRFAQFITDRIADLPPYDQAPQSITEQNLYYAEEEVDVNNLLATTVRIEVSFSPMRPGARSLTDPDLGITGFGQVVAGFVNSAFRLKGRLAEKARKLRDNYQIGGLPFLIAVGVHDITCSNEEVVQALFGSEAIYVTTGTPTRQRDGFFGVDDQHPNGRRQAFSGVLVLPRLPLGRSETADLTLFHNPWAAQPWPDDLLAATRSWGVLDRANGMIQIGWIT